MEKTMTDFTPHHSKRRSNHSSPEAERSGGIHCVAVEVPDGVAAYPFIRSPQQAYG
jgi:hypothetical protein